VFINLHSQRENHALTLTKRVILLYIIILLQLKIFSMCCAVSATHVSTLVSLFYNFHESLRSRNQQIMVTTEKKNQNALKTPKSIVFTFGNSNQTNELKYTSTISWCQYDDDHRYIIHNISWSILIKFWFQYRPRKENGKKRKLINKTKKKI